MASRGFMQAFSVKTDLKRFYRKQARDHPKELERFFSPVSSFMDGRFFWRIRIRANQSFSQLFMLVKFANQIFLTILRFRRLLFRNSCSEYKTCFSVEVIEKKKESERKQKAFTQGVENILPGFIKDHWINNSILDRYQLTRCHKTHGEKCQKEGTVWMKTIANCILYLILPLSQWITYDGKQ